MCNRYGLQEVSLSRGVSLNKCGSHEVSLSAGVSVIDMVYRKLVCQQDFH